MKKFWNWIHNEVGGRVLRLEGPVDEESVWGDEITPRAFREELNADADDITVWINSPGGNVFAAAEIYTKSHLNHRHNPLSASDTLNDTCRQVSDYFTEAINETIPPIV